MTMEIAVYIKDIETSPFTGIIPGRDSEFVVASDAASEFAAMPYDPGIDWARVSLRRRKAEKDALMNRLAKDINRGFPMAEAMLLAISDMRERKRRFGEKESRLIARGEQGAALRAATADMEQAQFGLRLCDKIRCALTLRLKRMRAGAGR